MSNQQHQLALFGGARAVQSEPGDLFQWPIVTPEDEAAVLDVLRRGAMSGLDITLQFEKEFAEDIYALATSKVNKAFKDISQNTNHKKIARGLEVHNIVIRKMNSVTEEILTQIFYGLVMGKMEGLK